MSYIHAVSGHGPAPLPGVSGPEAREQAATGGRRRANILGWRYRDLSVPGLCCDRNRVGIGMIQFTVYGTPAPAGSKRAFAIRNRPGRFAVTDDSKRSRPWKGQVEQVAGKAMNGQPLLREPIEATFRFYVKRPKGHFGTGRNAGVVKASAPPFPAVKPDVLKLARAVEDALSGVVYADDALIVSEYLSKEYGEPERVEVTVEKAA